MSDFNEIVKLSGLDGYDVFKYAFQNFLKESFYFNDPKAALAAKRRAALKAGKATSPAMPQLVNRPAPAPKPPLNKATDIYNQATGPARRLPAKVPVDPGVAGVNARLAAAKKAKALASKAVKPQAQGVASAAAQGTKQLLDRVGNSAVARTLDKPVMAVADKVKGAGNKLLKLLRKGIKK